MTKKPRVLHIINSLQIGGAESVLTQFLLETRNRTDINLDAAILYADNAYRRQLEGAGIMVKHFKMQQKYGVSIIPKIVHMVRKGCYRIVFAQLFPTTFYVALASLFLPQIHFVVRETNIHTRRRKYKLLKVLDRFIYSRYSKIVCVDKKVEEALYKWMPAVKGKTIVVGKGIVIPARVKRTEKKYDIVFVGRLVSAKGIDMLLEAIASLRQERLIRSAIIVGDGPLKEPLMRKALDLGISEIVTFAGERHNIIELLEMSRLFVLPSRWEGTPSALLEAMAVGLPVIAANVGGVSEVIDTNINGLLVPPKNLAALTAAARKVLTNYTLAKRLGERARTKIIQEYSISNYAERILAVYYQLIE